MHYEVMRGRGKEREESDTARTRTRHPKKVKTNANARKERREKGKRERENLRKNLREEREESLSCMYRTTVVIVSLCRSVGVRLGVRIEEWGLRIACIWCMSNAV